MPRIAAALVNATRQHSTFFRSATLIEGSPIIDIIPREGNEQAIGLDLSTLSQQAVAIEQVRREERLVLDGPVDLVQGGRGVIARAPVFRADASGESRYWGQVSILLDADQLFEFLHRHAESSGFHLAIRTSRNGTPVTGEAATFDQAVMVLPLRKPRDHWQIAITAIDPSGSRLPLIYRLFGWTIALLIGLLIQRLLLSHHEVLHLALLDPLTGLPNRRLFHDRLSQAINQSDRSGNGFFLLYIDLDNFKLINDTFGHDAGDRVLSECANRLTANVRRSDSVARVGGDEFMIILSALHSRDEAAAIASKLIHELAKAILFAGESLQVGASIGIACYPNDGETIDALTKRADDAMYRSKQAGKSRYYFSE